MACPDWSEREHHTLLYGGRPHEVYSRFVFRSPKTTIPKNTCAEPWWYSQGSRRVNQVQLVGNEAGNLFVPTYDWQLFFATRMRKVIGIKTYHQFIMLDSSPGTVTCKQYSDSTGTSVMLVKEHWTPSAMEFPSQVVPPGLSPERQWYLYDKIRPFCDEQYRDITCPVPRLRTPINSPAPSPAPASSPSSPPHHSTVKNGVLV